MKRKFLPLCAALSALSTLMFQPQAYAAAKTAVLSDNSHSSRSVESGASRPFDPLVRKLAKMHKVPADLIHAVIHTESNYNVDARGDAGEVGLMQIMPMTARALGFKGPLTELFNPEKNLEYGVRYLAKARQLGHANLCQTILKYNAGYGAKKMNPISKRYCEKVKAYLSSLKAVSL